MARIPRIMITGEPAAYHIMSRTALEGYPMDDVDKDFFVKQVVKLSKLFFVEVLGFCCMGNHFHLLVRMRPDSSYSDIELKKRLAAFYDKEPVFYEDGQLPYFREKLTNLSEYVREIKVLFARYYNKRHGRRGYFWGDRFKSVIVENGETLINCLAYIDLNPVRAGLVSRPEEYRWNAIGYHVQTNNKDNFYLWTSVFDNSEPWEIKSASEGIGDFSMKPGQWIRGKELKSKKPLLKKKEKTTSN